MGYTHYWTLGHPLAPEDIAALAPDVRRIVEASGLAIAGPHGDGEPGYGPDTIALNGADPDAYESFILAVGDDGFDFCKTGERPYDVVVTAILLLLRDHLGYGVDLSSDGDAGDWEPGRLLASRALGREVKGIGSPVA